MHPGRRGAVWRFCLSRPSYLCENRPPHSTRTIHTPRRAVLLGLSSCSRPADGTGPPPPRCPRANPGGAGPTLGFFHGRWDVVGYHFVLDRFICINRRVSFNGRFALLRLYLFSLPSSTRRSSLFSLSLPSTACLNAPPRGTPFKNPSIRDTIKAHDLRDKELSA